MFALLAHTDKATVNPLELDQWIFYILPAATLGARQSITLKALKERAAAVRFAELREAVGLAAARRPEQFGGRGQDTLAASAPLGPALPGPAGQAVLPGVNGACIVALPPCRRHLAMTAPTPEALPSTAEAAPGWRVSRMTKLYARLDMPIPDYVAVPVGLHDADDPVALLRSDSHQGDAPV